MIKYTTDFEDICLLWNEAFGDSREDIKFFVDNVKNAKCLAYYVDENIASMMYIIPCSLNSEKAYYVYAVSTKKEYQKNGFSSALLNYAFNDYKKLCLIPANDKLVDFYKKRGYSKTIDINCLTFDQIDELVDNYLYEGCDLKTPFVLVREV